MNAPRLDLTPLEKEQIESLADRCLKDFSGFDNESFLKNLPLAAYKVPERLIEFLNEFKYVSSYEGYCIVSTGMIDDAVLSPTPAHWALPTNNDTCQRAVMTMCLFATVLGDIFGWRTQQDGRVVHDVLPVKEYEHEQLGCGSREEITWHTEDAFHELRGDYLLMMCLRNPDRVPTTLSKPDYAKLTAKEIDILFEKQFVIRPDDSHKVTNNSLGKHNAPKSQCTLRDSEAFAAMEKRAEAPEEIAVLFGSKSDPCLRLDPYFMEIPKRSEAKSALEKLCQLVGDSLIDVSLNPGEILIIDNFEVVHGRRSFVARFDGTDRWFKRTNVTRDIRRCNGVLEHKGARVIY